MGRYMGRPKGGAFMISTGEISLQSKGNGDIIDITPQVEK
jgi:hypothetical protein